MRADVLSLIQPIFVQIWSGEGRYDDIALRRSRDPIIDRQHARLDITLGEVFWLLALVKVPLEWCWYSLLHCIVNVWSCIGGRWDRLIECLLLLLLFSICINLNFELLFSRVERDDGLSVFIIIWISLNIRDFSSKYDSILNLELFGSFSKSFLH